MAKESSEDDAGGRRMPSLPGLKEQSSQHAGTPPGSQNLGFSPTRAEPWDFKTRAADSSQLGRDTSEILIETLSIAETAATAANAWDEKEEPEDVADGARVGNQGPEVGLAPPSGSGRGSSRRSPSLGQSTGQHLGKVEGSRQASVQRPKKEELELDQILEEAKSNRRSSGLASLLRSSQPALSRGVALCAHLCLLAGALLFLSGAGALGSADGRGVEAEDHWIPRSSRAGRMQRTARNGLLVAGLMLLAAFGLALLGTLRKHRAALLPSIAATLALLGEVLGFAACILTGSFSGRGSPSLEATPEVYGLAVGGFACLSSGVLAAIAPQAETPAKQQSAAAPTTRAAAGCRKT